MKKKIEAKADFTKALELNPDYKEAREELDKLKAVPAETGEAIRRGMVAGAHPRRPRWRDK